MSQPTTAIGPRRALTIAQPDFIRVGTPRWILGFIVIGILTEYKLVCMLGGLLSSALSGIVLVAGRADAAEYIWNMLWLYALHTELKAGLFALIALLVLGLAEAGMAAWSRPTPQLAVYAAIGLAAWVLVESVVATLYQRINNLGTNSVLEVQQSGGMVPAYAYGYSDVFGDFLYSFKPVLIGGLFFALIAGLALGAVYVIGRAIKASR
jgi:hypothetical protein